MDAALQHIFAAHFDHYARQHKLALKHHKAARAIMACRTEAMGGHVQRCPDDHEARIQYHSCHHRSCPRCHGLANARWVEQQQARVLACDHYHVVFTLPHELLELWQHNTHWFANALFGASADTLMRLLADERHLGALPGIVMALHTWGRTLSLHPHVHCLVTGGGLDAARHWRSLRYDYLLPVAMVKALYKGKLLARLWTALNAGELSLPAGQTTGEVQRLLRRLNDKAWNVRIQERYPHGQGVLRYLARYVKGGAIRDQHVQDVSAQHVQFDYTDHHDHRRKTLTLTTDHFIQRVLWHVPEPGQHSVRQYGLYAHGARVKRQDCRKQLGQLPEPDHLEPLDWRQFMTKLGQPQAGRCTTCGKALLRYDHVTGKRHHQNSIYKASGDVFVQQGVRPDAAPGYLSRTGPP